MSALMLNNVVISTIKPFEKTVHPAVEETTLLDYLVIKDAYVPLVFFYKPREEPHEASNFVARLKESLCKVLVPYYPLAGRCVKTYDERLRELHCNDEGAVFIEASLDEEMESVVKREDFVTSDVLGGYHLMGFDPTLWEQDFDFSVPCLFAQVTKFKCGGVALHVAILHMAADGSAIVTFMKAWSEIALHGQTAIVPSHARSPTKSLVQFLKSSSCVGTVLAPEERPHVPASPVDVTSFDSAVAKARLEAGMRRSAQLGQPSVYKTLHVKRKVVEDLKREALEASMDVTTVTLIMAHVWRCLNRFPESLDNKRSSLFGFATDIRKRVFDPPLSPHFAGNAFAVNYAPEFPVTELFAKSHVFAANVVHNTVRAFKSSPSGWQSIDRAAATTINILTDPMSFVKDRRLILVPSWFRFPLYEVCFDHDFGYPFFAGWNWSPQYRAFSSIVIIPPPPGLSEDPIATLQLTLQKYDTALVALLSDETFMGFFHSFDWHDSFSDL